MNTQVSIKNFRIFDQEGASITFKPITILTGCNSSGKSSIVKSLLVQKEFLRKASEDLIRTGKFRPSQYNVEFTLPNINLKSFKSAVNKNHPEQPIILSYVADSLIFGFKVELSFMHKDSDLFDRAWLQSLRIFAPDDDLILNAEVENDVLYLKKLNLFNAYVEREYMDAIFAANYLYIQGKKGDCRDMYGEIENQEEWDKWEQERLSYLTFLDGGPKLRKTIFDIARSFDYDSFPKDYPFLSGEKQAYLYGLEGFWDNCLVFYFPVLNNLRNVPKKEVRKCLSEVVFNEDLPLPQGVNSWASQIADDFEASEFDSFIDYYRNLENEELSDIMSTQLNSGFKRGEFWEDFIEGVKSVAGILFDTNNHIHWLYSGNGSVDFNLVYRFLSCWQWSVGVSENDNYLYGSVSSEGIQSRHILYEAILEYLTIMLKKLFYPDFLNRLEYVGNFQSNVKRLYSFDDTSNNLGNTIREYLELKGRLLTIHKSEASHRRLSKQSVYTPDTFMNKWAKKIGIGNRVIIDEDVDGLGAKVYIKKQGERSTRPLADEGYGVSQIVTFLLHIENEILKNKLNEDRIVITGMSRDKRYLDGTPVKEKPETATLSIEEPEVSLHPSLQSQLTDIFYDAYKSYGIEFIVETHSEYLIRRSQAIIAKMSTKEEFENRPFAVYYIDRGGHSYELVYQESGRFENSFGPGFFDEASRSSLEILKREKRMSNE